VAVSPVESSAPVRVAAVTPSPDLKRRVQRDSRAGTRAALSQRQAVVEKQRRAEAKQRAELTRAAAERKRDKAEAAKRQQSEARDERQDVDSDASPKSIARQLMKRDHGWSGSQFRCYDKIIRGESGWKVHAKNPSSGAYGIPQALPGKKMASAGSDWRNNPATQITWGLGYVKSRYGTPCSAWSFKRSHGWY